MEQGLLIDVALCIVAAWVAAIACQLIKQPLLMAYLLAGFAIGPHGFRWIVDSHSIELIADLGLILLLFIIGLEMDLRTMFSAGKAITVTALVQIVACVLLGWGFFAISGLGHNGLEALYLGVAAAMSSTIIIIKMLYDKRELDTLAGRITLGVLVLQDVATIMFLAIQPNLKDPAIGALLQAVGKVLIVVGVAFVVSRFLLPPIFRFAAHQGELVLVGALAWCFAIAGLARYLGLSAEMGALIAGVMVSTFPYNLDVIAKVTSIRDFFVTLFFVGLGMTIPLPTWNLLGGMLVFSAFLVVTRLVTVFTPLYKMKLGHRVSLLPAINLCQMSELSLVLLSLGKDANDVSEHSVSVAALAFAFLAVDSTYVIFKSEIILEKVSMWLTLVGLPDLSGGLPSGARKAKERPIFLLGFYSTASSLLAQIEREHPALVPDIRVIDFNPTVNRELQDRGIQVIYGDIGRQDVLHHAGVDTARVIVCTLPDVFLKGTSNLKLLRQLRSLNPTAEIIVTADKLSKVSALYEAGASYVLASRLLEAADLMSALDAAGKKMLNQKRQEQAELIGERDEVLP